MDAAVYGLDGDVAVPTELAAGPWDPGLQHGGAPAALLARAAEAACGQEAGQVVRLSVELMRPIPLVPLRITTRTRRAGRKLRIIDATLSTPDAEVAQATAVWLRTTRLELPPAATALSSPQPRGPETGVAPSPEVSQSSPFFSGIDTRVIAGALDAPGPVTAWFRLRRPLVAGERPTPLVRVVAVADLANGISSMVDLDRWTYVNADLTVWCHRQATGEWVGLESHTAVVDTGVGCSHSALFDTQQPLGWSAQSLLIETRPTAPRTPRRAAPRWASPAAGPASPHPTASP